VDAQDDSSEEDSDNESSPSVQFQIEAGRLSSNKKNG